MPEVPDNKEFQDLKKRVTKIEMKLETLSQITVPENWTRQQVASLLRVSESTVSNLIADGRLTKIEDGLKRTLIPFSSIRNYQLSKGYDSDFLESELQNFLKNK